VSAISTWEIAIKVQSRKLRIDAELTTSLAAQQFELLPFSQAHAMEVLQLPLHHRDPFDRALIAQARVEGFTVMTADAAFSRYADLVALFEG
jgi:PIN domain nuclease of toxin-antitoxin system